MRIGFAGLLLLCAIGYSQAATFDATISWTTTSTNHDGSNVYRDGVKVGTVAKGVTTFSVQGLAESTKYCWKVSDYNAFPSEVFGPEVCVTTGVVVVPVDGLPSGPTIIYQGKP